MRKFKRPLCGIHITMSSIPSETEKVWHTYNNVLINCVQNITNMKKSSIKGKYSTVHTLGTLVEYFLKHGHHTLSTFTSVPLQCCKLASQEVIKCLIENNNSSSSIKQVHPYTQTGFAILQNNLFIIFSSNKRIEIVNQY